MKVKIYYDGNPANTRVEDADTGEMLDGVVSAHVDLDAFEAVATLVLAKFELDIDNVGVRDEDTERLHGAGSSRDNSEGVE